MKAEIKKISSEDVNKSRKEAKKESAKSEEVRVKLERTEKKLTKAEEKAQSLKQANLSLEKGMADLEKQLGEAKKSEDFMKLEELYGQVEAIGSWHRAVVLPFGEISFSVKGRYIQVDLWKAKPPNTSFLYNDEEQAQLLMLCDVINEAREKKIELEHLKERILPLADIIRRSSAMIDEHDRRTK